MLYNGATCHVMLVICNSKLTYKVFYWKTAIMVEQLILRMWSTILHLLSPKQHSMKRVIRISHIGTKKAEEKVAHQAGSPNTVKLHLAVTLVKWSPTI